MAYRNGASTDEHLERQNNLLQDNLASNVSKLKEISIALKGDVDEHNRYLDGMANDFGQTQGLLSGTVKRVNWMINSGGSNRKLVIYTSIGLVTLFYLTYHFFSS